VLTTFSYRSYSVTILEERIPADDPLRPIRATVDEALRAMNTCFDEIYPEEEALVDIAFGLAGE
jgi:hypothetical protein